MKKSIPVVLSLGLFGGSLLIGNLADVSAAGRAPSVLAGRGGARAYVPKAGSAVRKAIADALRRDVEKMSGLKVIFVFTHLKVNGNWAYAVANPQSPDGKNKYEPVAALLRRNGSKWSVAGHLLAEEVPEKVALKNLRRKFPKAPADIFPSVS